MYGSRYYPTPWITIKLLYISGAKSSLYFTSSILSQSQLQAIKSSHFNWVSDLFSFSCAGIPIQSIPQPQNLPNAPEHGHGLACLDAELNSICPLLENYSIWGNLHPTPTRWYSLTVWDGALLAHATTIKTLFNGSLIYIVQWCFALLFTLLICFFAIFSWNYALVSFTKQQEYCCDL